MSNGVVTVMDRRTDALKAAFLERLADCGNISQATRDAGIDRKTHYRWLADDADYKAAVADAMDMATDKLVQEARRRAIEGINEPVFQQGGQVLDMDGNPAIIKRYSDVLLMFLLKGDRPEKYRDKTMTLKGNLTGTAPPQVTINMLGMSGPELLEALLKRQENIRLGIVTSANDPDAMVSVSSAAAAAAGARPVKAIEAEADSL